MKTRDLFSISEPIYIKWARIGLKIVTEMGKLWSFLVKNGYR